MPHLHGHPARGGVVAVRAAGQLQLAGPVVALLGVRGRCVRLHLGRGGGDEVAVVAAEVELVLVPRHGTVARRAIVA